MFSWIFGVLVGGIYMLFRNEDVVNLYFQKKHKLEDLRFFEALFNYSDIGMCIVSREGVFLRVNDALAKLLQYTSDELLMKTFQEITHPDDLDPDLDFVNRMLDGEIKTYIMPKRYIRKDGSYIAVTLRVSAVYDASYELQVFVSQIQERIDSNCSSSYIDESHSDVQLLKS